MRKTFFILIALACSPMIGAQQIDTTTVLSYDQFQEIVLNEHPIAIQAGLKVQMAERGVQGARGSFDPVLFGSWNGKDLYGTEYYNRLHAGLEVPTWFGVEVEAGIDDNRGVYLNPESFTPSDGLWYAGVSVPIGQGLFLDQRRAGLRSAQIVAEMSVFERQAKVNELLYKSGQAYWDWYLAFETLAIYEEAVEVADQRRRAVIASYEAGDSPAIDTVEAGIQWKNRRLGLQAAQLEFRQRSLQLGVYLWADGVVPLEPAPGTIPSADIDDMYWQTGRISLKLDSLVSAHPELEALRLEIDRQEVDLRLKQEYLKPKLDLKYRVLDQPSAMTELGNVSLENYQWGVEFKWPLLIRKERAGVAIQKLKLEGASNSVALSKLDLNNRINARISAVLTTEDQFELSVEVADNYEQLLNGERELFQTGESSLFMVNSREIGFIDSRLKAVSSFAKNRVSLVKLQSDAGILIDEVSR